MRSNHHHHHHHAPPSDTKRVWKTDLFEVPLLPSYCFNLFCPWPSMYHIQSRLSFEDVSSEDRCFHTHITPWNAAHNCLACCLPCGLVAHSANRYLQDYIDEEEEPTIPTSNHSWFSQQLDMNVTSNAHNNSIASSTQPKDPTWADTASNYMPQAVCLGLTCLFPSMCWLRNRVDNAMHYRKRESLWLTGLITCVAWPCSLTQMIREIDITDREQQVPSNYHDHEDGDYDYY
jgi:hypothetical protein